jgi:geranylgeranyl diphosphate synthase type II
MNNEYIEYIESNLENVINNLQDKYPPMLIESIKYSVFSGGKRVRPYLMMLSAEFLNIPKEKVINQAIALEFIHTYSLIHDDLPAMDNDDYRRGILTTHKKYGEAMAVLCGDALLNLAYEILLKTSYIDNSLAKSCYFMSINAGGEGMVGGQALEFSNLDIDYKLYEQICELKTGALINNAVLVPANIDSTKEEEEALKIYGYCVGYIFQMVDDILDIDNDDECILKFTDKEKILSKINSLEILAEKTLKPFGNRAKNLIEFCKILTNRTK